MKNLSKLSLLIVFLSIFIYTPVLAATVPTSKATPINAVLIASVNIQNAKIVSQKGNVFNISFSFSNGEGLQTGVKYGVKLVSESKTGQLIIDERVYDESLTLNPNMTIKKDIIYTAPTSLSGIYTLMLTSNNSSGFPFGFANLGKVTLTATSVGIQILPESCTLQIIGDKTNKTYILIQGVGINGEESISLTCKALNSSKVDITTTPSYEVHSGSSFGDILSQNGGSADSITFKAGEKKSFSVTLPKATTPQIYNVNFTFNDKDNKSNSVDINYMILGVSATIENVSLDKDYYNKGDTALLSFVYRTNATSTITSKIQISNSKGKSCAEPQTQTLQKPIAPKVDTSIIITSSCIDPKISITLTDDKGVVLAQKEFDVKTTSFPPRASNSSIIWIIIILIVVIIIYIYLKRKKNLPPAQSASIPMGIFFFILAVSLTMIPSHFVRADTSYISDYDCSGYTGAYLDKDNYTTGEPINISGYISSVYCYGGSYVYNLGMDAMSSGGGGSNNWDNSGGSDINVSDTFYAPSYEGSQSVTFNFYLNNAYTSIQIPYSVTASLSSPAPTETANAANNDTTPSTSSIPRIMFWTGKVNQHVDSSGNWTTDSDGVSGGYPSTTIARDYGDRPVEYCNKMYNNNTTSVVDYQNETIDTWKDSGNVGNYTNTKMSYKCVISAPTVTISASKNTMVAGESVNISWISYDANSCSCTYEDGSCGTSTVNGSAQFASNNPYTLQQTKTFTVTCTN